MGIHTWRPGLPALVGPTPVPTAGPPPSSDVRSPGGLAAQPPHSSSSAITTLHVKRGLGGRGEEGAGRGESRREGAGRRAQGGSRMGGGE